MITRFACRTLLILAALAAPAAAAQPAEKPRIYVLVSAIGGEITVVRQRRDVGSNIEPFRRHAVPVADSSVDSAVLRGLDRAVASEDPDSKRIFMRLSSEQVTGVFGHQRGEVLSARALAALAQTMKVIETNERYDFQRIYDPRSDAIDVAKQMTPEVLSTMVEQFVEKASARALNDQQGEVIIREPRIVNPSTPK